MSPGSDSEVSNRSEARGSGIPRWLSIALLACAIASMQWMAFLGAVPSVAVNAWCLALTAGWIAFQGLIRTDWARRLADPTMMMPRVLFAVACLMAAYAMLGPLRERVLIGVLAVLVLGSPAMPLRQAVITTVATVVLVGLTSAALVIGSPEVHASGVEFSNFLVTLVMAPVAMFITRRVHALRRRLQEQGKALEQAQEQIRRLTRHDELTGLASRLHMQELLEQELQRRIRSGQSFCLLSLGVQSPAPPSDVLLQALARETLRQVRSADFVARWSHDEFVIMLPETRATLAQAPMERLVQQLTVRLGQLGAEASAVSLAGGLAEHRTGETVEQTLDRAAAARVEAEAAGGSRIHVA